MPCFRNENHILDPHSALLRHINTRLNGHHHPRSQLLSLTFGEPGSLMDLKSHSMACRVGEIGRVPCFLQYITPCAVHFADFRARTHSLDGSQLSFTNSLIHTAMRC